MIKLTSNDSSLMINHFMKLPEEDKMNRFHSCVARESIENYVHNIDWENRTCIAKIVNDEIAALGELVSNGDDDAEIAVSVLPDFQNRGIGRQIISDLLSIASDKQYSKVHMIFTRGNSKMMSVAKSVDVDIENVDYMTLDGVKNLH